MAASTLRICLRASVPFRATVLCRVRVWTLLKMTVWFGGEEPPRLTRPSVTPTATSATTTAAAMIFLLRDTINPPGLR